MAQAVYPLAFHIGGPEFDPRSVHVRREAYTLTLKKVLLRGVRSYHQKLRVDLRLHIALTSKIKARSLGTFLGTS